MRARVNSVLARETWSRKPSATSSDTECALQGLGTRALERGSLHGCRSASIDKMSTLSNAVGDPEDITHIDRLSDSDHIHIIYDSNRATMLGCLHQLADATKRSGKYDALIEQYAVSLSNGKHAVYSISSTQFLDGTLAFLRRMCRLARRGQE